MSSKRSLWKRFGRYLTGVTIACFFLPFFGVSCQGVDAIRFSGTDMVAGCSPGGLLMDQGKSAGKLEGGMEKEELDHVNREPFAIGAFAVAVALFGLAWARKKGTLAATCILAVIGIGCLGGLFVKVNGELDDVMTKEMTSGEGSRGAGMKHDMMDGVSWGSRFGLWLVAVELAGIAVITGMAMREPELPDDPTPSAPPVPPSGGVPTV